MKNVPGGNNFNTSCVNSNLNNNITGTSINNPNTLRTLKNIEAYWTHTCYESTSEA